MTTPRPSRTLALFGLAVVVTAVAIAQGVGNLYPFSRFEMYAATTPTSISRLGVRTTAGDLYEASLFRQWQCDADALATIDARCSEPVGSFAYLDRVAIDHVRRNLVASSRGSAQPVTLVRRIWRVRPGVVQPSVEDCEVVRCRAERDPNARAGTVSTDMFSPATPRAR